MPTTPTAELYFIAGAFVLILLICTVTVYVFFRQLKREKSSNEGTSADRSDSQGTVSSQEEE